MRAGLCSLAFVLALTGAVPTSAQQGSISGVVVATRTNAENRETVLLKVPARTSDRAVEEVRVRVGRAVARVATPALLPAGWQADDDGDELRLSGPALAAEESILARFVTSATSSSVEAIKRVRLELHGGGDRLLRVEIPVERLPAVTANVPIDDVIGLPPVAVTGEVIKVTPYDFTLTPYGGTWTFDAADDAEGPEVSEPVADPVISADPLGYSFELTMGARMDLGMKFNVQYADEFGEVLVDGKGAFIALLPDVPDDRARIDACTARSFRGRVICVCGWFPDETARGQLTIDGMPLGNPLTSSRRVLYFRLPDEIAAGPHTIASSSAEGSTSIEVLELVGQIDQAELLRGQSTPIHITILGTRDALPLHLVNHAPDSISLDGGDDQVITTSGGDTNTWTGRVQGNRPGNFHLTYELAASRCPCAEIDDSTTAGPEGETWYDDAVERFRHGRDLANEARDAQLNGDDTAGELAEEALDELERARKALQEGIESGDIGPETEKLLEQYISEYESQARRVSTTAPSVPVTPTEEPDDDGPRDAPPPTLYGEELDEPPVTTVLDGWLQPSQGVWQDDDDFRDTPGKRLTRTGPATWQAELKMVAGRSTAVFGIRDDAGAPPHNRIHLLGETTATTPVKVRFRFTLIQGGTRTVVYEQPDAAAQSIPLDGPAREKRTWSASLITETGVPEIGLFTFTPGPYTIEAELIRVDTGAATGLKATVSGEAVTTSAPTLHFVPVALGETGRAGRSVLGRKAQTLSTQIATQLPTYLPVADGGITTQVHPLQQFPEVQPGVLRELISMLPRADDSDTVRRDRLKARLTHWLGTQAALTGGGKVVAILQRDEFDSLWPNDDAAAFAAGQKLMVATNDAYVDTIGHELVHTTPFLWSRNEMIDTFGFSYHNYDDRNLADGVELFPIRQRHDQKNAMMGPAGSPPWITQGTYWHMLEQFLAAPDPPLIVTRGFLARDGGRLLGRLDALYEVMGVPDLPEGARGPAMAAIELRDAAGSVLGRFPFRIDWREPHRTEERSTIAFTYTVPELPGTAMIALVGPDGAVLHTRQRSASAPQVRIVEPADGGSVAVEGDRLRVSWDGSDADGDALTYMVLYSPDGGETWRVEGYEVTGQTFDVPVRGRPASPRVRVIATDGARSGMAEVAFSYAR